MSTRLELSDGTSNKFWEITVEGKRHTVRFGRIGTDGQTKTKSFADEAAAQADADKLIGQKTKKGYAVVSGGATAGAAGKKAPAKKAAGKKTPAKKTPAKKVPVFSIEQTPRVPRPGVGSHETAGGVPFTVTEADLESAAYQEVVEHIKSGDMDGFKEDLAKGASLSDFDKLSTFVVRAKQPAMAEIFMAMGAHAQADYCARLAAQEGDREFLSFYLRHGVDFDHYTDDDRSLLVSAASNGQLELVKWLMTQGAIRKESKAAAVRLAAQQGELEVLKYMVEEQGVDPNGKKGRDKNALVSAARRDRADVIEYLVGQGASIDGTAGKLAIEKAISRGAGNALAKLAELGAALNPVAAQTFQKSFEFLVSDDEDRLLLQALSAAVKKVNGKPKAPVFVFEDGDLTCEPPYTGAFRDDLPRSFNEIATHFNGITWDAGGPEMGYGGLSEGGHPICDSGGGLDALSEGDEEAYERLSEAGAEGSFVCGQNWILFDPTRKNAHGEMAVGFVSHESCDWEPVVSADKLDYRGVMLRLMAAAFVSINRLPEIYA